MSDGKLHVEARTVLVYILNCLLNAGKQQVSIFQSLTWVNLGLNHYLNTLPT